MVPDESAPALQVKTLKLESDKRGPVTPVFEEIDDFDLLGDCGPRGLQGLRDFVPNGLDVKAAIKKAEVQYTDNIEHCLS